jgi:hypothetical protein
LGRYCIFVLVERLPIPFLPLQNGVVDTIFKDGIEISVPVWGEAIDDMRSDVLALKVASLNA